jgi:hypothetical protein
MMVVDAAYPPANTDKKGPSIDIFWHTLPCHDARECVSSSSKKWIKLQRLTPLAERKAPKCVPVSRTKDHLAIVSEQTGKIEEPAKSKSA